MLTMSQLILALAVGTAFNVKTKNPGISPEQCHTKSMHEIRDLLNKYPDMKAGISRVIRKQCM